MTQDALTPVPILVRQLDPTLPLPRYAHPGDAGADLVTTQDVTLQPGERAVVGTGIALALPAGFAAFVHPRSGLAARSGVSIVNTPGTVDAGYRGEIRIVLVNHDPRTAVSLRRGDRIAQLVIQRVERAQFVVVDTLPGSARAEGGYGSTGVSGALDESVAVGASNGARSPGSPASPRAGVSPGAAEPSGAASDEEGAHSVPPAR